MKVNLADLSGSFKLPKTSCVYLISNNVNDKVYIGKTINLRRRFSKHISEMVNSTQLIYRAIRKHGIENFYVQILHEASADCDLLSLEQTYIKGYSSLAPRGYNMTAGGEGMAGALVSEQTREKKRETARLNPGNWEAFAKVVKAPRSEAHKQAISEALKALKSRPWLARRSGVDSPVRREVIIYPFDAFVGVYFETCRDAALHYRVNPTSITNWASGKSRSTLGLTLAYL